MVAIFLGPAGSGKDTQANLLAEKYGVTVVSPGELLRDHVDNKGKYAEEASDLMKRGELVPDSMLQDILYEQMKEMNLTNVIITGAPRNPEQIPLIDELFARLSLKLDKVVHFNLSDEQLIERLSGRYYAPKSGRTYHLKYNPPKVPGKDDETGEDLIQRADDTAEGIKKRLEIYHNKIQAILPVYRERGVLIEEDASPSIEDIAATLEPKLLPFIKQ